MDPVHALGAGRFRRTCKPASTPHPLPRYDVSGVGLNLGTAEEFATKTVSAAATLSSSPVLCGGPQPEAW